MISGLILIFLFAVPVSRHAIARLFFEGEQLLWGKATRWWRDLSAGAAIRRAHAQVMESPEFQIACESPRDAAGCRALEQKAISDHRAGRSGGFSVLAPQCIAFSTERHQEAGLVHHL